MTSVHCIFQQLSTGKMVTTSELIEFTLNDLRNATMDFDDSLLLARRKFGRTYRGSIPNIGQYKEVVIKFLYDVIFDRAEVNRLGGLHHPNLVKLIGYYAEGPEFLLVSEYMPLGNLRNHIFSKDHEPLPWEKRVNIALGVAKALAFLHKQHPQMLYKDLKTSDILINQNYEAQLSNFGLPDRYIVGSEYYDGGGVVRGYGPEDNVYSFGMILLEILTGREAVDRTKPQEIYLCCWARRYLSSERRWFQFLGGDEDQALTIIDGRLGGRFPRKSAYKAAMLAGRCISSKTDRPNMNTVVRILERVANEPCESPSKVFEVLNSKYYIVEDAERKKREYFLHISLTLLVLLVLHSPFVTTDKLTKNENQI